MAEPRYEHEQAVVVEIAEDTDVMTQSVEREHDALPTSVEDEQPIAEPTAASPLAVRFVATALSEMERARIAVISPAGMPGSQTSWVLARHLAAKNRSTVVIEFGEEGAVTREMLGRNDHPGFFNLISGAVPADRIIFKDKNSKAHVVPSGALFPGQPLPDPEVISELVDVIAEAYEFCIVDCGDVEGAEARIVSDSDTVAVISCIADREKDREAIETNLLHHGFDDVLLVTPDDQDAIDRELVSA